MNIYIYIYIHSTIAHIHSILLDVMQIMLYHYMLVIVSRIHGISFSSQVLGVAPFADRLGQTGFDFAGLAGCTWAP